MDPATASVNGEVVNVSRGEDHGPRNEAAAGECEALRPSRRLATGFDASILPATRRFHAPALETPDPFPAFFAALEARQRGELSFQEIRRALQALSSLYVERRERIAGGHALDGAGKRAAFALYYGPLHFLLVREIARALGVAPRLFPVPPSLLRFAGACAGRAAAVERLVGSLEADTSAFRGRFAWTPPRTLAEELAGAFAPGAPL